MSFSRIQLQIENDTCELWLGSSEQPEVVADLMEPLGASRYFVVCDDTIRDLMAWDYAQALSRKTPTHVLVHAGTEHEKNLAAVAGLADEAIQAAADRRSVVVALGGGLTGNVGGLLAALLFRGVRLVHIPTTFLAMSDSVFSLKQGVNSSYGKNALGTYHLATMAIANLALLGSLPEREVQSAMCEVIKNALAISPAYISDLKPILNRTGRYDEQDLLDVLRFALSSKQQVMANDRFERRGALVCEYGHTVGHAIELKTGLPHGMCIGFGMLVAAEVSYAGGCLSDEALDEHYDMLLRNLDFEELATQVSPSDVVASVRYDNKRGYLDSEPDHIPMVLLDELGRPRMSSSGIPLVSVALSAVEAGVGATLGRLARMSGVPVSINSAAVGRG